MNVSSRYAFALCVIAVAGCGGGGGSTSISTSPPGVSPAPPGTPAPPVNGPAWWGYARDAQHSATGAIAAQSLQRTLWQTRVDLNPQYSGGDLLAHYGSPVISAKNTIVVPLKTLSTGGFEVDARTGSNGALMWSATSDYVVPPHGWLPPYNLALTQGGRVYFPGAGGKLFFRDDVDSASGNPQTAVFYG